MFFPWWVKKSYGLLKPMGSHEDRSQPATFYFVPYFCFLIQHSKIFQKGDSVQSLSCPTLFHPTLSAEALWRHRDFVSMPGLCQARVITIHLPWISSVSCLDQMPTLVHWAAVQTPWPLASRGAPVHTRPSYTITGIRPASELVLKPVSSLVSSLI